jgi:hypothetical protein
MKRMRWIIVALAYTAIKAAYMADGSQISETAAIKPPKIVVELHRPKTADCIALQKEAASGGEFASQIKSILQEAISECGQLEHGFLSSADFLQRIWQLERRAANMDVPAGLRAVIPFRSVGRGGALETYSLFLFPSIDWESRPSELASLHNRFVAFGDAIGERRIAIWLSDNAGKPDVLRSKFYCDLLGLDYNKGPYIVTTGKHPSLLIATDQVVVVSLSGISSERTLVVLNALERDLRTARELHKRTLLFEEVIQRLLTAADRNADTLKEVAIKTLSLKGD